MVSLYSDSKHSKADRECESQKLSHNPLVAPIKKTIWLFLTHLDSSRTLYGDVNTSTIGVGAMLYHVD